MMQEKRTETRILCSDLVEVRWRDKAGRSNNTVANLEDISAAGACLRLEKPIPNGTAVLISHPQIELEAKACYCVSRDGGYFIGVQFEAGTRWSPLRYRPQHMLDPRRLVTRTLKRR